MGHSERRGVSPTKLTVIYHSAIGSLSVTKSQPELQGLRIDDWNRRDIDTGSNWLPPLQEKEDDITKRITGGVSDRNKSSPIVSRKNVLET